MRCSVGLYDDRTSLSVIRILIECYVHLRTKLISTMSLVRYKHYGVLTAGITLVQWLSLWAAILPAYLDCQTRQCFATSPRVLETLHFRLPFPLPVADHRVYSPLIS